MENFMTRKTTHLTNKTYIMLRDTRLQEVVALSTTCDNWKCVKNPFFFQSNSVIVFSRTENYFVVFYKTKHSSFKHVKVVSV
jgi:hypothetical protein